MNAQLNAPVQEETVLRAVPDDTVGAEASTEFVNSTYVRELTHRALSYLAVGYPVHLSGPSGTGKTTLAFHIAAQLGRPVSLIHGDDEFGSSDLVGKNAGFKKTKVVDNYIHTVMKTEEEMSTSWQDNRLTTACRNGYTLIYDEFTRSRPEANNALLSVLEEKILNLPRLPDQSVGYMEVHPGFKAIFTSNPEEYVGVHKTQDALMDRLITIHIGHFNRETEVEIIRAKSDLPPADAEKIADIVREVRASGPNPFRPSIRAGIAIAKVLAHGNGRALKKDPLFLQICLDVLSENVDAHDRIKKTFHRVLSGRAGKKTRPRKQ
ncbi:MAG: gas vesicle protein GvpN [Desulfobacter sp.]